MSRLSLWRLYFFRIFRVSFFEPTVRGIGWINLGGFMLGTFAILMVTSTMGGFFKSLRFAVSQYAGDISLLSYRPVEKTEKQRLIETLVERFNKDGSGSTISFFETAPTLVSVKGRHVDGFLEAALPGFETKVSPKVHACLKQREFPSVVLGQPMKDRLKIGIGDVVKLFLVLPSGVRIRHAKVCGFYSVGFFEYDRRLVWISRFFLNDLDEQLAFGAKIFLPDQQLEGLNAERVALNEVIGPHFYGYTWYDRNQNLFEAIETERMLVLWVIVFIILVASFNLISHLYVHYNQRSEVFQLLYVLGERKKQMMALTMIQGGGVGLLGSAIGAVVAWIVVLLTQGPIKIPIPREVYNLAYLPLSFDPAVALVVVLGSGVLALVISGIPALRTAEMFRIHSQK